MKIEIRLFATLASYAGHGEMDSDGCLSFDGPATIRDAVLRLGVPEQDIKLVFLNGVGVSLDSSLKDKDRVGIFPPIGGGMMPKDHSLESRARIEKDVRGKGRQVICDQDLLELSQILNIPLHQMYLQSMEKGILPLRYLRNMPSITLKQQITLQTSQVAVVGAGGLGGHVIEGLCRLGIGGLHIFDPDAFDETNLNRQVFADQNTLGNPKVQVMQEYCRLINPAVQITAHQIAVKDQNQDDLFADVQVIVDALDTPGDRLTLAAIAGKCRLPLVHGTVAGFGGRVMVIHPLDGRMETLYGGQENACSAEYLLGTPVLSPALVASFQVMAVLNILFGKNKSGDSRMIYVDMEKPSLDLFEL